MLILAQSPTEVSTVLDGRAIAALVGVFLPLLVQAITKQTASSGLKAVLNLIGSALVTVLAFVLEPGNTVVNWVTVTNVFIAAFLVSAGSYKFIWQPTGVTGTIADKTSNFGVGSPPTLETADKGEEEGVPHPVTTFDEDDVEDFESLVGEEADDNLDVPVEDKK